jgi:hypothetical protein
MQPCWRVTAASGWWRPAWCRSVRCSRRHATGCPRTPFSREDSGYDSNTLLWLKMYLPLPPVLPAARHGAASGDAGFGERVRFSSYDIGEAAERGERHTCDRLLAACPGDGTSLQVHLALGDAGSLARAPDAGHHRTRAVSRHVAYNLVGGGTDDCGVTGLPPLAGAPNVHAAPCTWPCKYMTRKLWRSFRLPPRGPPPPRSMLRRSCCLMRPSILPLAHVPGSTGGRRGLVALCRAWASGTAWLCRPSRSPTKSIITRLHGIWRRATPCPYRRWRRLAPGCTKERRPRSTTSCSAG